MSAGTSPAFGDSVPTLEQALGQITTLQQEMAVLRAQIEWFKKQLFGGGKGERLDRSQLLLQLDALEKLAAQAEAPVQKVSYERAAPTPRPPAGEAFAKLPVQETIEIVPAEVQAQPDAYERIGEERTFEIEITPPKVFKREFVRPKFRHKTDRAQPPLLAPAPARPVTGGYASASLLAWVTTAKYVDHLPLYRQEKMLARWGAPIPRQTLSDWIAQVAGWTEILRRQLHAALLKGDYLQLDETWIRCNDPDHPSGKTATGWLWALSRPGGDVVFFWRMSRRHEELPPLLEGYRGLLHSDGYEAYPQFVTNHPGVTWLSCWAHARRKFTEALAKAPATAGFVLRLIGQLYRWEREWDHRKVGPAWRAALRSSHFKPTLALLKRVAEHLRRKALPQSPLGLACGYLLNHWSSLCAHCDHGQSKLDTNSMENAIRGSAVGKKNYLFVGHPDAGERAAIIYSLVESCRRRRIDPFAYFKDVLARLPAMTSKSDFSVLLPANWKPAS